MESDKIARDNHAFFFVSVGHALCSSTFDRVMLYSLYGDGSAQCGIGQDELSGYLRVDSTDIINRRSHEGLAEKVRRGILGEVAMKIPYGEIKGDLNDHAEVIQDGYRFSFKIVLYERSGEHGFELIEDPSLLPDDEQLDRLVELKIAIV